MAARKVHDVLAVESVQLTELPRWMGPLLKKAEEWPNTSKPPALLVSERNGFADSLIVLRVADLMQLIGVKAHPMEIDTPDAV